MKKDRSRDDDLVHSFIEAWDEGDTERQKAARERASRDGVDLGSEARVLSVLGRLSDTLASEPGEAPAEVPALRSLGRFRELELIGTGGQSSVYKAYDTTLERTVALKVFKDLYGDVYEWMKNEAASMAQLRHDSVVMVHDADKAEGHSFLITELVDGPSLRAVLEHRRSPKEGEESARLDELSSELSSIAGCCRFAIGMARALHCGHERDVVHCDVKPGNVLIAPDGRPKLIDFGLATSSSDGPNTGGSLHGTPQYLAPERARGERATAQSDVFALGVVLYEILTLRNPFDRRSVAETLNALARVEPPPPSKFRSAVPVDLERIVLHALEKSPEVRYASAAALANDLEAFLDHRAISIAPPSPWKLTWLWMRRNRTAALWSIAGLAAVLMLIFGSLVLDRKQDRSAILEGYAELRARLPEISNPAEFEAAFVDLERLGDRAEALDASFFGAVLPRTAPEMRSNCDACCARLHEVLAAQHAMIANLDTESARTRTLEELLLFWSLPLGADKRVCPDSKMNEADQTRGQLALGPVGPGEHQMLLEHQLDDHWLPRLRPLASLEGLFPRTYRLVVWDQAGNVAREIDHVLKLTDERKTLIAPAPRPSLTETLQVCDTTEVRYRWIDGEEAVVTVPSFSISRDFVTWADLRAVFDEAEIGRLKSTTISVMVAESGESVERTEARVRDDYPACVAWRNAQEYAFQCGARLPTISEARAAPRPSVPVVEDWIPAAEYLLPVREWTSTAPRESYRERLVSPIATGEPAPPFEWGHGASENGYSSRTAFRIARSVAPPVQDG